MKQIIGNRRNQLLACVSIILLTSLLMQLVQIKFKGLYLGHDWVFHYNRFYDTAQQIKDGNFQYFISMYGFDQSARITNALYGPLFAYFNGALLLICGSWLKFQFISNYLITALSALSMFLLLTKSKVRLNISVILSILYATLYVVQTWSFNQIFNSWGSVILPLGILAGSQMLKPHYDKRNILYLALVVSLSVQMHMLTTLFLLIILSMFFVVGLFKTQNKVQLFYFVSIAAILTIFMTGNVWYPLIETQLTNELLRPVVVWDMENGALKLNFLHSPANLSLVVFTVFCLQFVLLTLLKVSTLNKIVSIQAFTFFVFSTKIIPWNVIAEKVPQVTILQFPFRLLLPAVTLVIFAIGLSLESILSREKFSQNYIVKICLYTALLGLTGFSLAKHFESANNQTKFWHQNEVTSAPGNTTITSKDSKVLRKSFHKDQPLGEPFKYFKKSTPDYVPVEDKKVAYNREYRGYPKYAEAIFNNPLNPKLSKEVKDNTLHYTWTADVTEKVTVPVFVYNRTELTFNGQQLTKDTIEKNDIGALKVVQHKGENHLMIQYKVSKVFYITLWLSIISWLGMLIALIKFK